MKPVAKFKFNLSYAFGSFVAIAVYVLAAQGCSGGSSGANEERAASQGQALSGLSSASVQLLTSENACANNVAQDYFNVVNRGTSQVTLSDLTIKYWVNDTSGTAVVPHVWYGGCVTTSNGTCIHPVNGVTATATSFPACGPDASHQANWEITVSTTDTTPLAAGNTWSGIQTAINLANYASFSPGSSTWYSPCGSGQPYSANPHFGVYVQGNLVFSNGITAPSCRGPHGQQQLSGYVVPPLSTAPLVGPMPQSSIVHLAVGLPLGNAAGLASQVQQVSDPASPSYRQYLTVDQFTATYGPSTTDYQNISSWAQSRGLATTSFPNRVMLDVAGTVAQIEQALFVNMNLYSRPDGTQFFAPDRDPSLDSAVTILRISGLDNFFVPKPKNGSGAGGAYLGSDFRNAYASCTNLNGAGQSVGLVELDGYSAADIQKYEMLAGIPNVTLTNVLLDGVSGTPQSTGGNQECALDIEMAIAMAPGLSSVVVQEGTLINSILNSMATTQPLSLQLSSSWDYPIDATTQQLLNEIAVQGQTYLDGSGDSGAFTSDPGDDRDSANITLVGGTVLTMNGNGVSYASETTWPGSSGGVLKNVPIPGFQVGLNMSTNGGSTVNRNVPDVALIAQNAEVVFTNVGPGGVLTTGQITSLNGTSIATPLWAGYMALINQQAANNGVGPVGFFDPVLYAIGQTPAVYAATFHDINDTSGNGGFNAVAGYDLTTGWGTPQCALINQLANSAPTNSFNLAHFLITTGADNLRGDSEATADLFAPGATTPFQTVSLKPSNGVEWANGSVHDVLVPLSAPQPTVQVGKVVVHLIEHDAFIETDDNWNIEAIDVRFANTSGGPELCVVDLDGDPVVRLTGSAGDATFTGGQGCGNATPLPPPPATVNTLDFTITTGADNLRQDSQATVDLFLKGASTPFQTIQLKASGDPEWANNSVHDLALSLSSAQAPSQIDHLVVNLIEHDAFIETDDNWNIEGINVMAFNPGSLQFCLADENGDPFVRLTGSAGSVTLTSAHCP
jgi:hypothetical protein